MKLTFLFAPALLLLVPTAGISQTPSPDKAADPGKATAAQPVSAAVPNFFGVPCAAKAVQPADFAGLLPAEVFQVGIGMGQIEVGALRKAPKNFIATDKLGGEFMFAEGHYSYTNVREPGKPIASVTERIFFDSWNGSPPTRERVKRFSGGLYKTLGHPGKVYESPARRGLAMLWETPAHSIRITYEVQSYGRPRAVLDIRDKKLMPRDIERPGDWVEAKVAAGPAGFRARFDKWLPTFLTDAEEIKAQEAYVKLKAAMEKSAAAAAETPPKTRTVGGGTGEASVTVEVKLKKKEESGDKTPEDGKPAKP